MTNTHIELVSASNLSAINIVAEWYSIEWNIPIQTTIQKFNDLFDERSQFQVLLTNDGVPITTGGVYNYVGLLDREPSLKVYENWLALVYTQPEYRGQGYGALICEFIANHAKFLGLKELYLFTHTAESLYKRLGWQPTERLTLGGKAIVIMKKEL